MVDDDEDALLVDLAAPTQNTVTKHNASVDDGLEFRLYIPKIFRGHLDFSFSEC